MPKISAYSQSVLIPGDELVVARSGKNYKVYLEYGGRIVWDSATGYHVEIGAKQLNGGGLIWTSNITRAALALAADTLYYIYLYDSGGAAVEESTTVPVWNSTYRYWQKTGAASRRLIGAFYTDGSGNIYRWTSTLNGNTLEIIYQAFYTIVSAQASTGAWTSFSLANNIPIGASHWNAFLLVTSASGAGDDGAMAVSPFDQGADTAVNGMFSIRMVFPASNKSLYPGRMWVPIETAQTSYYRTQNVSGSVTGTVRIQGYRLEI